MESDEVRRAAATIEQIGDEVRQLATAVSGVAGVPWRSAAATAFRHRLEAELSLVSAIAVGLDEAAQALKRHAVALEHGAGDRSPGGAAR